MHLLLHYVALTATFVLNAYFTHASTEVSPLENTKVLGVHGPYSYDPVAVDGPSHWGDNPEYLMCRTGKSQSPIDLSFPKLTTSLTAGPKPVMMSGEFRFASASFNWAVNCANATTCGYTLFKGRRYNVVGLHFHSPSEHRLNGRSYPLEAHIVHASADGRLAVISTMFDYPEPDSYASQAYNIADKDWGKQVVLAKLLQQISAGGAAQSFSLNVGSFVRPWKGYSTYRGSLTTPPCSESVRFFMALHVGTVTRRQVAKFKTSTGVGKHGNNRPVMPLNGRKVIGYI